MATLATILQRELLEHWKRTSSKEPLPSTNQAQAEFLHVGPGHLSKLRRGVAGVPLTEKMAWKITRVLRPSSPIDQQEELVEELLAACSDKAASPSADGSMLGVSQIFERLSSPGSLLCVEYRDLPRADRTGKYPGFAKDAGRAIASGLSFALFQPFIGREDLGRGDGQHTTYVQGYIETLRASVRSVYSTMLHAALEEAKINSKSQAQEVKRRIILYERDVGSFVASGLQSRLFYAEIAGSTQQQHEVWEWVAGKERDYFIERDEKSLPPDVVSQQFAPITSFWEREGRLPYTGDEMTRACGYAREMKAQMGPKRKPRSWWSPVSN